MSKSTSRIILDVNLLISYLISSTIDPLFPLIIKGKVTLLFSEDLMAEFIEVASRPKFEKYFNSVNVAELVTILNTLAIWVKVTSDITICRDPKDNYLLSLAKDGKADYLITDDQDLLILEKFEQTSICLLNQFLRCL